MGQAAARERVDRWRSALPSRRGGGTPLAWVLGLGTAALAALYWVLVVAGLPGATGPVSRSVLLLLVLGAAVTDTAVLQVAGPRRLHGLGLQSAAVAAGLLLAPLDTVVLAVCLGRLLRLLASDATPSQVVAQTASTAFATLLGGTLALLLGVSTSGVPDTRSLLAATAGAVVAGVVSSLAAVGSAAADGEEQPWRLVLLVLGAGTGLALAGSGLGAGAATLAAVTGSWPVVGLLLPPAALLVVLGSTALRSRRTVSALRQATLPDGDQDLPALLDLAVQALGATRGELLLADEDGAVRSFQHVPGEPGGAVSEPADAAATSALPALLEEPQVLPRVDTRDAVALARLDAGLLRWLLVRGHADLLSTPVHVEGRPVGALAVAGRPRGAARWRRSDLVLLETTAERAGLLLARARQEALLAEVRASHALLQQQATRDDLTGLARRPLFLDRVAQALGQRGAEGRVAVLYVDLDGFKAVNDRLGHGAGDTLLRATATRLSGLLRGGDTAARLGGDEFAVLLLGLDGEDRATLVAARLLDALSLPVDVGEERLQVRASVGVAVAGPTDDAESLLDAADTAMYLAKRSGGGTWHRAQPEPPTPAAAGSRAELLVRGLSQDELPGQLEVHYQPCVDLRDGQVLAVEALARWRHPELGLVLPSEFVPLAVRLGRMVPLGRLVLRAALTQIAAWDAGGGPPLVVSVNLSDGELRDPGLAEAVQSALADTGLPGDRLVLEVGEESLRDSPPVAVMRSLEVLGVRWSLSGFGAGWVPLAALDALPLHSVKIPVSVLTAPPLSNGLVGLARGLGLRVDVEGVERATEADAVRDLDCDRAQGYHYGHPEPARSVSPGSRGRR